MGIPWQSILAGLGQGAAGLGDDINRRKDRDLMLGREDEIRRMANERQQAQDALNLLTKVQPMGGQVLPENADPIQALAQRSQANTLASGGAIPNSALGIPDESVPDAFGSPYTQKIGQANVLFDPSKSQDAMQERRFTLQQAGQDRRAREADARALEIERLRQSGRTNDPDLYVRLQSRISELVRGGKPLKDASEQARLEFGQAPPPVMQPSYTPVTIGGGEDKPAVVVPFNTKSGTAGEPIGEAKPATTRIESATNTAAKARLEAAVSEMNNAHSNMADYEQRLANGQVHINAGAQVLGRVANAFTHDDPVSQLTQSGALAALNSTDPDLARYIRRGLSFAEGESMVSQRPSDFRTKMAAFLSTAASGASPEMIHDIQGRRKSILDPLNRTVTPGGGRSGGGNTSTITAAERQALKAKGFTDAQINAKYGPP